MVSLDAINRVSTIKIKMSNKKLINEDAVTHQEKIDKQKIKQISFISFLMGFAQAVMIYVMSSYFKQVAGTENVGFFYYVFQYDKIDI